MDLLFSIIPGKTQQDIFRIISMISRMEINIFFPQYVIINYDFAALNILWFIKPVFCKR